MLKDQCPIIGEILLQKNNSAETIDFEFETLCNVTWYTMMIDKYSNNGTLTKMAFVFYHFTERHNELCKSLSTAQRKKKLATINAVNDLITLTGSIIRDPTKRNERQHWLNLNTASITAALTTPENSSRLATSDLIRQTTAYIARQPDLHDPQEEEEEEETNTEDEDQDELEEHDDEEQTLYSQTFYSHS